MDPVKPESERRPKTMQKWIITTALLSNLGQAQTLCDYTIENFHEPIKITVGKPSEDENGNDTTENVTVSKVDLSDLPGEYRKYGEIAKKRDPGETLYGKTNEETELKEEFIYLSASALNKGAAIEQINCLKENFPEILRRDKEKYLGSLLEVRGGWGAFPNLYVKFLTDIDPASVTVESASATATEDFNALTQKYDQRSYNWYISFNVKISTKSFSYFDRPAEGHEKLD